MNNIAALKICFLFNFHWSARGINASPIRLAILAGIPGQVIGSPTQRGRETIAEWTLTLFVEVTIMQSLMIKYTPTRN